jgi:hypothetical protein
MTNWSQLGASYFDAVEQTRCVMVMTKSRGRWPPGSMIRQTWPLRMLNRRTQNRPGSYAFHATISPEKQVLLGISGISRFRGIWTRRDAAGCPFANRCSCSAFWRLISIASFGGPALCSHERGGSDSTNHWSSTRSRIIEEDSLWFQAFETCEFWAMIPKGV